MISNAGFMAVAAILAISVISRSLWHLVWRPYTVARWFQRQGIRGPPYRIVVGSLLEMRRMNDAGRAAKGSPANAQCHDYTSLVAPFFHKWASDYGPVPALCSTDMELLKQVLDDRTDLFQKDYLNPVLEIITRKGLLTASGDDWKRHYKVIGHIFKQDNLKSVSAVAREGTQKMIEQLCAKIESSSGGHQAEIDDMTRYSEELATGTIEQVIFGKSYKETREVFVAGKEVQKLAAYALSDPSIPGYRYLPTRRNLRAWKLDKLIRRNVRQLIKARIAGGGVYGDDLLGLMLEARRSEAKVLSTEEIIGECLTFFAAGEETSASLLTWAMFLLSSYPQWQEKLREEVQRECLQDDDPPIINVLGKMKLLNMFILETLRLYSPLPLFTRKATSDTKLANIQVPKGTVITFPVVMLHRSKDTWGLDADEFNPMRFENGASRAAKHSHALLAFSYGPRGCIGRHYAMVQVQTVMAMILRRFSFTLSPHYVHKPKQFITLVPRYGLPLIVRNLQQDGQNK
uniref:Uncharacterized protein n=1 Tax=Avena sativa TaxID=4498 RepID=A0ACD5Y6Y0_AVESA